jgi:putative two-component system response regulator
MVKSSATGKIIFIVDDNDVNLLAAKEALSSQYRVFPLASAATMFELLEDITPDMILLDIEMPEMDGFQALKKLKSDSKTADIPVIFLTSRTDDSTEALGFEMGVVDFKTKPFSRTVLLNRIKTHLNIENLIQERTDKLQKLQTSIVSALANMVENRDKLTGTHIDRTTRFLRILLEAMLERGIYIDEISKWDFEQTVNSSRLHDVGKIAVSDSILNKPGKLTPEEFDIMKTHATEGEKIIDKIISESGDEDFLHNAKLFAAYHHERWDGTGYPYGLKETDIPLQGRIMALVDVYDALVSERPYKKAFTHENSVEIIIYSKGKHFDPKVVDVFLEVSEKFAEVAKAV